MKLVASMLAVLLLVRAGSSDDEARTGGSAQGSQKELQKRGLTFLEDLVSGIQRVPRKTLEKPTLLVCKKIYQGGWTDC